MPLACPVCQNPLFAPRGIGNVYRCAQHHSFDVAKEGYLNLHLVQHKNSHTAGDTKASLQARQRFLARGFYAPLKTLALEWLAQGLQAGAAQVDGAKNATDNQVLLDIGCGEGYYTTDFAALMQNNAPILVYGLDIAKPAIQIASRASKTNFRQAQPSQSQLLPPADLFTKLNPRYVVASAARLPFLPQSVHAVSSFFAPILWRPIAQTLMSKGGVLVVRAADAHLHSIRTALFGTVQSHAPVQALGDWQTDFKLLKHDTLTVPLTLDNAALTDLVTMTPYAYKAKLARKNALLGKAQFATEASFALFWLQKK